MKELYFIVWLFLIIIFFLLFRIVVNECVKWGVRKEVNRNVLRLFFWKDFEILVVGSVYIVIKAGRLLGVRKVKGFLDRKFLNFWKFLSNGSFCYLWWVLIVCVKVVIYGGFLGGFRMGVGYSRRLVMWLEGWGFKTGRGVGLSLVTWSVI